MKNRLHLDLLVDDIEREVRRLESLGASRLIPAARLEYGQTWFVLADPVGNEFWRADVDTNQNGRFSRVRF